MLYRYGVLLVLLVLPVTALAQNAPQLHWDRYDNIVEIRADGSVQVQERQELIVDRGPANGMNRTFETGNRGRVSNIRVFEDGQLLRRRDGRDPGTYSGSDDGQNAKIRVNFRDPQADSHTITIEYTIDHTLIANSDRAVFEWNFFWSGSSAPEIRDGRVELQFPGTVSMAQLRANASGAPSRQSSTSSSVNWELSQPIQGRLLAVEAAFPRTLLADTATFRSPGSAAAPVPNVPGQPESVPSADVAIGLGIGGLVFCIFILVFLFIVFMIIRASARTRRGLGYPTSTPTYDHDPLGTPYSQRGWRQRRHGGWGGGWGFPPIMIMPPSQSHTPYDNTPSPFDNTPLDSSSGGGSSSWGDSGGGSSSWGDSGGGSSSWGGGDSGGGGSGGGSFD